MDNTVPSGSGTFAVGDRIAVEWVREADDDSLSVKYANLTDDDIVQGSETWYEGSVVRKRAGQYGFIDILFSDQDLDLDDPVRISLVQGNRHYLDPAQYASL
jgi:hypothetical protein